MGRFSCQILKRRSMKILFHVGVGNTDRPERWTAIGGFFNDLGSSLEALDHQCAYFCHSAATGYITSDRVTVSDDVYKLDDCEPDVVFTWNGISDGDKKMIELYGREKFIFAELGFFNHYQTCYFDACGTNYLSMNVTETLDNVETNKELFRKLQQRYKKPCAYDGDFIFVPLQDENDTQITKLSPFKTMYELLEYTLNIYNDREIRILYKPHPSFSPRVPSHPKLQKVTGDVHSYIPYAETVVGINSTVLFETLLYHQRVITCGVGITSRRFLNDEEREKFIVNCYNKQLYQASLKDIDQVKKSWVYGEILRRESLLQKSLFQYRNDTEMRA